MPDIGSSEWSHGEASGDVDAPVSLLEHLPIGLLLVDAGARIVSVNEYAARMLDYERGELIGQCVEVLVPDRSRQKHEELRRAFARDPRERRLGTGRDLAARRKDGSVIPVEIGLKPIRSQGQDYSLVMIVDIRDRKRGRERPAG